VAADPDKLDQNQGTTLGSPAPSAVEGRAPGASGAAADLPPEEIDTLLNFDATPAGELTGVQALINSALVAYERLPMLEIVFDRLVRLATTSLRNFTSDTVEVAMESISSVRFGEYIDSIPMPSVLGVVRAEEWDNFGLLAIDDNLIYSMIDVLLGGRRSTMSARGEGRPYTTIERVLVRRMIEVLLEDMTRAFEPITDIHFRLERVETNPRFAAISRPANAAILIELRIEMDERGGKAEILLPYATIEPIREQLLQMFMGEKFGRDPIWEGHLATEIYAAEVDVEAVLHEVNLPLSRVLAMEPGDTVMFDRTPSDPITLRCGDVELTEAVMGHIGKLISVRVSRPLNPPKVTMAAFEAIDEKQEGR
jgi:flagellar motor switch protein FliM